MEANNIAKMRDVLGWLDSVLEDGVERCEVARALAAPPRNCDVGTAEEQTARFDDFCHDNRTMERCCGDCPAYSTKNIDCQFAWAQMPYEEGAYDGSK